MARIIKSVLLCLSAISSSGAFGQCQLRITSVTTCDSQHNAVKPKLGDKTYGIKVNWSVTGRATTVYGVKVEMADRTFFLKQTRASEPSDGYWAFVTAGMPLDGSIPVRVTLDPDNSAGATNSDGRVFESSFTPDPPTQTVEYYDRQRLQAEESVTVQIPGQSGIDDFSIMFSVPTTETFQNVLSVNPPFGYQVVESQPFGRKILRQMVHAPGPGSYSATMSFTASSSNVVSNLSAAMRDWKAYEQLPKDAADNLAGEQTIQVDAPEVKSFVKKVLPADFRNRMTPYEAARRLFVATALGMDYETPAALDAVVGLTKCKGDCGTFSAVYAAAMRGIGIPVRLVCGWRLGKDQWHCWTEMFVPGVGWAPQDVTDCHTILTQNHSHTPFAYCFSIVPDLNCRVAVTRGTTYTTEQGSWTNMQNPQWGVWGDNPVIPKSIDTCLLTRLGG